MKLFIKHQLFIIFFLFSAGIHAMPMLTFNNEGKISGATGLEYEGLFYRATLSDGTCASIFSGCDSNSDFMIGTVQQTSLAELFFNTFIGKANSPLYIDNLLDSTPSLAVGCSENLRCFMHTPRLIPRNANSQNLLTSDVRNYNNGSSLNDHFVLDGTSMRLPVDFSVVNGRTWLSFSADTAPSTSLRSGSIPSPGTLALLAMGLISLGLHSRLGARSRKSI